MRYLSAMVTIARGSLGGITFTANQFHQLIARGKTAPVNPKTPNQETMRLAFSNSSSVWKSLTQAVRDDWNEYAKTVYYPGPLGDYQVPGRNIFIANHGLVSYINARGLDTIVVSTAAPVYTGVPAWADIKLNAPVAAGTGFSVHLGNTEPVAMNYFITHSNQFDPSRERFKGPFLSSSAKSDEVASSSIDDVDFLGLLVGQRYFVRIKGVTVESGHRQTFEVILSTLAETTSP